MFLMMIMTYFSFMLLLTTTLIMISSSQWFFLWMGLELMVLLIIPISLNKKLNMSTYIFQYYLIQCLASNFMLMSIIINNSTMSMMMLLTSMLMKLGSFPFYIWIIKIIPNLNESIMWILLTWQKLIPLMIFSFLNLYSFILALLTTIVGAMGGIFNKNFIIIFMYSSISQTGWMMSLTLFNWAIFIPYFLTYSFLIISSLLLIQKFVSKKTIFGLILFSIMGIPPFFMFWLKWSLLMNLFFSINNFFILLFLMSAIMSFYFYFSIMFQLFKNY